MNQTMPPAATLGECGEFGFLSTLLPSLPTSPEVSLGPGDDAAVVRLTGELVVSTDVLVEGVHFKRAWSLPHDLGRKAVAVNAADLEAMGAEPVCLVVGLSAPADVEVAWLSELMAGMVEEAEHAGLVIVGGDTTGGRDVTLSVTVMGQTAGRPPVTRSGAQPGDVVAVCGRLGWAAAGLAVLSRGFRSPRAVVEAQRCPTPPYGQGRVAAAAGATSMIDVSDGLLQDLGHLCERSGVGIDVDTSCLEVADPLQAVAAATGMDPLNLVLTGGEDHALAATFPSLASVPDGWRVVGHVREGADITVDGVVREGRGGWDHFAS